MTWLTDLGSVQESCFPSASKFGIWHLFPNSTCPNRLSSASPHPQPSPAFSYPNPAPHTSFIAQKKSHLDLSWCPRLRSHSFSQVSSLASAHSSSFLPALLSNKEPKTEFIMEKNGQPSWTVLPVVRKAGRTFLSEKLQTPIPVLALVDTPKIIQRLESCLQHVWNTKCGHDLKSY